LTFEKTIHGLPSQRDGKSASRCVNVRFIGQVRSCFGRPDLQISRTGIRTPGSAGKQDGRQRLLERVRVPSVDGPWPMAMPSRLADGATSG